MLPNQNHKSQIIAALFRSRQSESLGSNLGKTKPPPHHSAESVDAPEHFPSWPEPNSIFMTNADGRAPANVALE